MNRTVKHALLFGGLAVLGVVLAVALGGLPAFGQFAGPYGMLLNRLAPVERHVTNIVSAINFDYRGLDTLGEEFILFAAVSGVCMLLRDSEGSPGSKAEGGKAEGGERDAAPGRPDLPRAELAALAAGPAFALLVVFGVYVALHAALTPGGGFQGGAILGTATILVYLTRGYEVFHGIVPKDPADVAEALAAAGYALIGLAALVGGGAFLANGLPLGTTGALLSSGTILLINLAVTLEVAAGFAVLMIEFTQEIRRPPVGAA